MKEGESSVCFGHRKSMDCHTEDTKNEEANIISVRSSTCTTRGSRTSDMVWFITLLLRALL